jgi:protein FAM32A
MSSSGSSSAYAFKPGGSLKLKGDDGKKDKKK